MKTTVRAFVIALTLTGAIASARTPATIQAPAQIGHSPLTSNFFPIPMCPPNDPNACGFGK